MTEVYSPKIKPEHLARKAIVYLRQSSDKQVRQNKESQILQYAVAERVRALGWKQVETISSDLGSSAGIASAQREGFERVLSLVALVPSVLDSAVDFRIDGTATTESIRGRQRDRRKEIRSETHGWRTRAVEQS